MWQEIHDAALVGIERRAFEAPAAGGKAGALIDQLRSADPEATLLGAAAILTMQRRTGMLPAHVALPECVPAEAEDQPLCSHRSAQHLARMLHGEFAEVLPEWLDAAGRAGKCVPADLLPQLLSLGDRKPALQAGITPVIGQRGRWLAAFGSDWNYAIQSGASSNWEMLNHPARVLYLKQLRSSDPAAARALLEATWASERADERAELLEALKVGLNIADEPFLESALDDRSRKVWAVAVDLLARLPASGLVQRMIERMRPLVTIKQSLLQRQIDISLPEVVNEQTVRDGVIRAKPSGRQIGERQWWLVQMIQLVPPGWWCDEFKLSPKDLVALIVKSEWEALLAEGWIAAVKHYPSLEWCEALLSAFPTQHAFLADVPPDMRETCLLRVLPELVKHESALGWLQVIADRNTIHHPDLGRLVLKQLQEYIDKGLRHDADPWRIMSLIADLGMVLPPELAQEAKSLRPSGDVPKQLTDRHIKQLIATLDFRRIMLQELAR